MKALFLSCLLFSSLVFSDDLEKNSFDDIKKPTKHQVLSGSALEKKAFEAIKQTKEYQNYIKFRDDWEKSYSKKIVFEPGLIQAINPLNPNLTPEEIRNTKGRTVVYKDGGEEVLIRKMNQEDYQAIEKATRKALIYKMKSSILEKRKKDLTNSKATKAIKKIIETEIKKTKEYQDYIKLENAYKNTKEYQIYQKAKDDYWKFYKLYENTKEYQNYQKSFHSLEGCLEASKKSEEWQAHQKIINKLDDEKTKICEAYEKTKEYRDYLKASYKLKQIQKSKEFKAWSRKNYNEQEKYRKTYGRTLRREIYASGTSSLEAIAKAPSFFPKNPTTGEINIEPDSPFFLAYKKLLNDYNAYKKSPCQKAGDRAYRELEARSKFFDKCTVHIHKLKFVAYKTKEHQDYIKAIRSKRKAWKNIEENLKEYKNYKEAEMNYNTLKDNWEEKILKPKK